MSFGNQVKESIDNAKSRVMMISERDANYCVQVVFAAKKIVIPEILSKK